PQGNSTLVLHHGHPERRLVLRPQHDVRHCAVSPDGRLVVTCSWWWDGSSKTAFVWDAETGKQVRALLRYDSTVAKFSRDGRRLMTSDSSNSRLWEVGTWQEVRHFDPGNFCFSPAMDLLALNDRRGVIRLLEANTGREIACLTSPDSMGSAPIC